MVRWWLFVLLVWNTSIARAGYEYDLIAPNPEGAPVNQLTVSGNACGPAALLSSFSFASSKWQNIAATIPGQNDRSRLSYVIRRHGLRPSNYLKGRPRWSPGSGVNLLDLTDMANELCEPHSHRPLQWQVLLQRERENGSKLVRRCHRQLSKSLKRGLPPVVSLQRLSVRDISGTPAWVTLHGHFVVITAMPKKLPRGATWMPFQYADPWGGKLRLGIFQMDETYGFPALVARVPESKIGERFLRPGEKTIVVLSSGLGAF